MGVLCGFINSWWTSRLMKSTVQSLVNQMRLCKDEAEYLRNIVRIWAEKPAAKGFR